MNLNLSLRSYRNTFNYIFLQVGRFTQLGTTRVQTLTSSYCTSSQTQMFNISNMREVTLLEVQLKALRIKFILFYRYFFF